MKKNKFRKRTIILGILACLILAVGFFVYQKLAPLAKIQKGRLPYLYTEEKEKELFPFDEDAAKMIDESESIKAGETWAIYMYLNGSNLELDGHSQLSNYVEYIANAQATERLAAEKEHKKALFTEFFQTAEKNKIPMPLSFFDADYNKAAVSLVPEEKHTVSEIGWGSDILDQIRTCDLPENVTFVVQPAGAKAWKDVQVNPNRTRRFVKSGQELIEVYDAPVTNMGDSETLTDFLKFCRKNYPADHTMVILTDHGGAMNGFGWDNVFEDDNLTLRELTEAFDNAYGLNEKDPPIDLLYFNACLMSNTDVINSMRGVCKYMIAGEEVGLAVFEYYGKLAAKLCENPNMNALQLGKALIDCYVNDLATYGAFFGAPPTTGLCLLDMSIAPKVSDAYADLARKVLSDTAGHPDILAKLSRAVAESVSFAVDSYKQYNTTDLGLWVSEIADLYPDAVKEIVQLIDDAVIYKRADSYLKDAHGISVYFPNYVEDLRALSVALGYIDSVSYSEDISALYYYKLAGCMNDDYKAYCTENGITVPAPINYSAMSVLRNSALTPTDDRGNVKATIDEAVYPILTDARFELCKVNLTGNTVTYYGEDRFVDTDGANGIQTAFEGKWVNFGTVPLYVTVLNTYEDNIIYESPVKYKGYDYKLILQCSMNTESGEDEFTLLGLRHPDDGAAKIDRDVEPLTPGQYITPVYYESNIAGGQLTPTTGKEIQYKPGTTVKDAALTSGTYRVRIVYEDMRGDDVYSAPVFFEVG